MHDNYKPVLSHGFILLMLMSLLFYFLFLSINHDILINYLAIPPFFNFYSYVHNFII